MRIATGQVSSRLHDFWPVQLSCAGMCRCVSDEERFCRGACAEVRLVFCTACVWAVLGAFCRAGDYADSGIREGPDSVSEMVLGVLTACRHGGSYADECIRESAVGECNFMRMDQRGKSLDVRRTACGNAPDREIVMNAQIGGHKA